MKKLKDFWTLTRRRGGFTLIELIVVIAILAVLAGVGTAAYTGYVNKANEAADNQLLAAVNKAFAAACAANGDDVTTFTSGVDLDLNDDGTVYVESLVPEKYRVAFAIFYEGNESAKFKYYTDLNFDYTNHVFKGADGNGLTPAQALMKSWEKSSFADGGAATVNQLLGTFDGIGGIFSLGAKAGIESFRAGLLSNVSPEIADALGLTGMFNGVSNAMQLSDTKVDEMLTAKGYNPDNYTDAEWRDLRAQVRGNAAVLYFANDTKDRSVDEVLGSVNSFANALQYAYTPIHDASTFKDNATLLGDVAAYYEGIIANDTGLKATYENADDAGKANILYDFYSNPSAVYCGADFQLSGAALVEMSKHTTGTNSTGITSLGAMYALAAGYYNNAEYSQNAADEPSNFGEFTAIKTAMLNDNFMAYCNSDAGKADLEAYLSFMDYVSSGEVDLTDSAAFSGQYGYIADALGLGTN